MKNHNIHNHRHCRQQRHSKQQQRQRQFIKGHLLLMLLLLSIATTTTTTTSTTIFCYGFQVLSSTVGTNMNHYRRRQYRHHQDFSIVALAAAAAASKNAPSMEPEEIKRQLLEYLELRKQLNADEQAKAEKGKVVGGTKGNKILEYISGAPVKEQVVDRIPNVFDYDQLTKYGYSNLVTPIMDLGGRRAVYELMDMEPPPLPGPPPKLQAPKLVIDRTGQEDKARYSGLKMGQVLDDNAMAEALARANEKAKRGESLRAKLLEEEYEQPFSDKRNVGPRLTPDWTPEKIDEYTKSQGRAISWAKKAKMGEFIKDPDEDLLAMPFLYRLYFCAAVAEFSFAFGRSTPTFLQMVITMNNNENESNAAAVSAVSASLEPLQAIGLALAVASIVGSVSCAALLAPKLNRSVFVWAVKGFVGGPLAVRQLRELDPLITRGEQQQQQQKEDAIRRNNNSA